MDATSYEHIQDRTGTIGENEPVFILCASDPHSPDALRSWAALIYNRGKGNGNKMRDAMALADAMDAWRNAQLDLLALAP